MVRVLSLKEFSNIKRGIHGRSLGHVPVLVLGLMMILTFGIATEQETVTDPGHVNIDQPGSMSCKSNLVVSTYRIPQLPMDKVCGI